MRTLPAFLFVLFALAVADGVAAPVAEACDTSYWTVGCQFYSSSEGHTRTQLGLSGFNSTHFTFDTFANSRMIWTTAGGTWRGSELLPSNTWVHWHTDATNDKFGCFNQNGGTEWVNCREYQGWGES